MTFFLIHVSVAKTVMPRTFLFCDRLLWNVYDRASPESGGDAHDCGVCQSCTVQVDQNMGRISEHDAGDCHEEIADALDKVELPSHRMASEFTDAL